MNMTSKEAQTKKEKGEEYRLKTAALLAVLGYASTRQVARGVFGNCSISSRKMAGRTLRWLKKNKLIVTKRDGESVNGEQLSALTAAGVKWMEDNTNWLFIRGKSHARDWLRHSHSHRTACNSVYVAVGEFPSQDIWSELEVRAGDASIKKFEYVFDGEKTAKIPDLIAGTEWIEVENTWRSDKDLKKTIAFMQQVFRSPNPVISCVHFVITAPVAMSIGRRIEKALQPGDDFAVPVKIRELNVRILKNHLKVSVLDKETLEIKQIL